MSAIRTPIGRRIYYDDIGTGPPLLLLTGWGGARRGFVAHLPAAIVERFRIVAMDNRDAGESDPEPDYYTSSDMVEDVVVLLDALGIARTHVMGYSMGCTIALQLALDHPDGVDHLILLSGAAYNPNVLHRTGEPLPPPAPWWIDDPVERWRALLPDIVGPAFRARLTDETLAVLAELDRGNRATWAGVMRQAAATAGHDYRDRLGEIGAPALVINGALDPAIPVERTDALAQDLPDVRRLVLPGVGHMVLEEAPDAVTRAILDFLPVTDRRP